MPMLFYVIVCVTCWTVAYTSWYCWRLGLNGEVSWAGYIQIPTCRAWGPLLPAGIVNFW